MSIDTDDRLRDLLGAERIVVIGCSTSPGKDAHDVPAYLQRAGYEIVPVNPFAEAVLGETAYDELGDVPGPIELVDVFRPAGEVAGIVDAAIDRGDVAAIWTQLGIVDDDAAERAREAGIEVVQDRCMRTEHRRLF